MSISPFLLLNSPCDLAVPWIFSRLEKAGLRPVQTFDLHAARAGLHDCPCPSHGTDECACQMIILLVYGEGTEPISLIVHGNEGQTWLSLSDSGFSKTDLGFARAVQHALAGGTSAESLL